MKIEILRIDKEQKRLLNFKINNIENDGKDNNFLMPFNT